jgi:cobalt-zinc-cadmium efflux system protein
MRLPLLGAFCMAHHHHHHEHEGSVSNIRSAFFLNLFFAFVELSGGFFTNSIAIISDAIHDFGDCISLGTAWYLQKKSKQPENAIYTYGYKRFSLLGAFINSIVLTVGSVFIIKEAIERIQTPSHANAKGMLGIAVLGIIFNSLALLRLKKGSSINERVISLHFLEDVLGWVAVLISAAVMLFIDIPVLDSILSLAIAGFILFNVYRNLKPALRIILQGVPDTDLQEQIRKKVLSNEGVNNVHDFRLWSLDGEHNVISMHITTEKNSTLKEAEFLKEKIKKDLQEFDITHATIEVEYEPEHCDLK